MARKRFTAEQIIMKPREAEVGLAQGKPPETTASLGIAGVAQPIGSATLRPRTGFHGFRGCETVLQERFGWR